MHLLGSTEGKGRGHTGKLGVSSRLTRGNKKLLNGGYGNRITSFLSETDESPVWNEWCKQEGHRYHISTGLCVRCGQSKPKDD